MVQKGFKPELLLQFLLVGPWTLKQYHLQREVWRRRRLMHREKRDLYSILKRESRGRVVPTRWSTGTTLRSLCFTSRDLLQFWNFPHKHELLIQNSNLINVASSTCFTDSSLSSLSGLMFRDYKSRFFWSHVGEWTCRFIYTIAMLGDEGNDCKTDVLDFRHWRSQRKGSSWGRLGFLWWV